MKRILLRVVPDPHFPPGSPDFEANAIIYAEVIRQVIRRPLDPTKGADIEEMRRGIRVLDAVDKAGEILELEDADWEHLKVKTFAMPWAFVDKRIMEFIDAITGAEEKVTFEQPTPNGQVRESVEV